MVKAVTGCFISAHNFLFFHVDIDANNIFKAFFGGPSSFSFEGRWKCPVSLGNVSTKIAGWDSREPRRGRAVPGECVAATEEGPELLGSCVCTDPG